MPEHAVCICLGWLTHSALTSLSLSVLHLHISLRVFSILQGLADTFIILGMAFDGPEAKQLNKDIFECIYYNALVTSCALAKENGESRLQHWLCTAVPVRCWY